MLERNDNFNEPRYQDCVFQFHLPIYSMSISTYLCWYVSSLGDVFAPIENGRSPAKQAAYQLLALLITFGLSVVSGAITGE